MPDLKTIQVAIESAEQMMHVQWYKRDVLGDTTQAKVLKTLASVWEDPIKKYHGILLQFWHYENK